MQKSAPTGAGAQGQLDVLGLHAAACARHTNRHGPDEFRDHLAQYARSGGITATIEQARPAYDAHGRRAHDGHRGQHDMGGCHGHSGTANTTHYG